MALLIEKLFNDITLGETQVGGAISVIPLYSNSPTEFNYVTLSDVSTEMQVQISELDGGASVGQLKLSNLMDTNLLLIDGEELEGSKQNRALNTSIVVRAGSDTVIPVSCTEHGRWSSYYQRSNDSGVVMPFSVRSSKKVTVDDSLKSESRFESNQSRVWDDISELHRRKSTLSHTGAMKDTFRANNNDLNDYCEMFQYSEGQNGALILMGGEVAGLEYFSQHGACRSLYPKIIKSYAMDAPDSDEQCATIGIRETCTNFMGRAAQMTADQYESPGIGIDYRFEGGDVTGSALVCDGEVVHMSFYNIDLANRIRQSV